MKKLTELITGEIAQENIKSVGKPKIISIPKYKSPLNFVPPEIIKNAPKRANAYIIGNKGDLEIRTSVLGQDVKKYARIKIEDDDICYNFYPVQYYIRK